MSRRRPRPLVTAPISSAILRLAIAATWTLCLRSGVIAQYVNAPQFFDVDAQRRFANDSLLAIAQPPVAAPGYTSMARQRFPAATTAAAVAEAARRAKRQWGAMAMPAMAAPFLPQQQPSPYAYAPSAGYAPSASAAYCPMTCAPCSYAQCRGYQVRCMPSVVNCCCPTVAVAAPYKYDLKDSCDGEEAVAGCINGLCGQGYVCTARRFCCRCASGRSIGNCVNGLCPQGFVCNDNNYCCSASGANGPSLGAILGRCVNDRCPVGYVCEADNYCHAAVPPFAGVTNNLTAAAFFTPGAGPVILGKCVNDRCPVGYSCGVGNLCYSNARVDGQLPSTPYVLGRCDRGLCPLGYTCGTDDFCYSNVLPVARIGARPEVLGRCDAGLCPGGYACGSDDFCHRNAEPVVRSRPPRPRNGPTRRDVDAEAEAEDSDSDADSDDVDSTDDDSAPELRRRRAGEAATRKNARLRKVAPQQRRRTRARGGQTRRHKSVRYGEDGDDDDDGDEDDDFIQTNKVGDRALNDAYAPAVPAAASGAILVTATADAAVAS